MYPKQEQFMALQILGISRYTRVGAPLVHGSYTILPAITLKSMYRSHQLIILCTMLTYPDTAFPEYD